MAVATIFNYQGLSQAEIERAENRLALQRTPTQQLRFLTDLIELSASLHQLPTAKSQQPTAMTDLYQAVHDFFQKLNEHGVQYLLIGGFAVNAYGHARNTGDLDLWVNDTPDNRQALGKACAAAGIAGGELLADMQWAPGWTGFHLPNGFKVEIMGHLKSFTKADFPACFAKAKKISFDGVEVPLIHLADLLKEKAATGRPKDLEDVEQLRKIDEERN
ncbi:MAG: nucleotidyltransferase [Saprospiraceae bacterium]|jgi:hypothetical protein|nr:nucleotidyltransferase [Saprospiraceae bacterium]